MFFSEKSDDKPESDESKWGLRPYPPLGTIYEPLLPLLLLFPSTLDGSEINNVAQSYGEKISSTQILCKILEN